MSLFRFLFCNLAVYVSILHCLSSASHFAICLSSFPILQRICPIFLIYNDYVQVCVLQCLCPGSHSVIFLSNLQCLYAIPVLELLLSSTLNSNTRPNFLFFNGYVQCPIRIDCILYIYLCVYI